MFDSPILDVVIGVVFIFVLVSIICTAIREGIEAWLKTRATYLEYAIRELLHDKSGSGLARHFYKHPLIYSLFSGDYSPGTSSTRPGALSGLLTKGSDLPSYIPSQNFALALLDLAARGPNTHAATSVANAPGVSLDTVRTHITNLNNPEVQRVLLTAIDAAQGDLGQAVKNLEAWYDSAMERVSGWYKRSTQWVIFWLGLAVAAGLNINTITIVDYLYSNSTARAVIVAQAEKTAVAPDFVKQPYAEVKTQLTGLSLPIGWTEGWGAPRRGAEPGTEMFWNYAIAPLLGWLLTAFAATLGAPFWFDVLNKIMVIRSTVKPPEKRPAAASGDRQLAARHAADSPGGLQAIIGAGAAAALASTPFGQLANAPNPADRESDIDGCDVDFATTNQTADDKLPAAQGGVA
jgi:hypothetical protein